jgi:hypothetical protein
VLRSFIVGMALGVTAWPCIASNTVTATVGELQSLEGSADCIYFTLSGVSVADPALGTGSPWFAMARTTIDAARVRDGYAMLLSAKVAGMLVSVSTTGGTACGYAQVSRISMP